MTAADVLRQAEELKAATQDTTRSANEAWISRQALQDVYQKLLVMDLEFALDKKIEQELWNHAFKNQISTLQNQAKDKQNQKRGEIQASLNLFLETASGFYLQLLQEICSTFKLDLPFRKKASCFGIINEYGPVNLKIKLPKKSSCMYICQHCLVHLGDIARYRQQTDQAQAYYRHAARLVPYNGQPYNQLAILEAAKGNKLSTVFYYVRSIAVKHPFPVAMTNLEKLYGKISRDSHEYRSKLTASDLVSIFLQLHTFVHLCVHLSKARSHIEKILANLLLTIGSASFSSYQLVQMIAINLYALYHAKRQLGGPRSGTGEGGDENGANGESRGSAGDESNEHHVGQDQQVAYDLMFTFTVSVFEALLQATPKQEPKAREAPTLAAVKVIFDWLRSEPEVLSDPAFSSAVIWMNVSKLLNTLQMSSGNKESSVELQKYSKMPLPEDTDLECFLPVGKALSELDFNSAAVADALPEDVEQQLRCQRLIADGFWVAEEFPSLNLLNVQRSPSGKLEFSTQLHADLAMNGDCSSDFKSTRQNVAIQAILKKTSMPNGTTVLERPAIDKITKPGANTRQSRTSKKESDDIPGIPQRSDASVMANPVATDFDNCHQEAPKWMPVVPEPEVMRPPIASVGYAPNIRSQFPYHGHPNQMFPGPMFTDPRQMMPSGPRGGVPVSMYDGGFVQQSFPPRFAPGTGGEIGQSMQLNPEVSRSVGGGNYDVYSGMYRSQTPMPPPLGSPKLFPVVPNSGYPPSLSAPIYVPRPDGSGFGNPLCMPAVSSGVTPIQSQPWPPPAHCLPFPQFPLIMSGMSPQLDGGNYCNSLVNVPDAMLPPGASCVSPDLELMEASLPMNQRNSPQQQQLAGGGHIHRFSNSPSQLISDTSDTSRLGILSPGSSAFCRSSPTDLQLSRSLPTTVKFGGSQLGSFAGDGGFSGTTPPQFDSMMLSSVGKRTFQPVVGHDDMTTKSYGFKAPEEALLSPPFSRTPGFGLLCEKVSSAGNLSASSLFTNSDEDRQEPQAPVTNTYSLFSQSPWPLGISSQTTDSSSHRSSPFDSSNSGSLRATPDPYLSDDRSNAPNTGGFGHGLFGRTAASGGANSPWKTLTVENSVNTGRTLDGGVDIGTLTANMQSLWSGGPSPLEKLLEQQKQQRQMTPR